MRHQGQRIKRGKRTPDLDGRMHPTKEEANWYNGLIILARAGTIRDLEAEPSWTIKLAPHHKEGEPEWLCNVKADARYFDTRDGLVHVVDWKGRMGDTAVSALKRRAVKIQHGVEIELVGDWIERKRKAKARSAFEKKLAKEGVI